MSEGKLQITLGTSPEKFFRELKQRVGRVSEEIFRENRWGEESKALLADIETALLLDTEESHAEWRARWTHWFSIGEQTILGQLSLGVKYKSLRDRCSLDDWRAACNEEPSSEDEYCGSWLLDH